MTLRFSRKKIPVPPKVHSLNHEIRKSASTQSDLAILVCDNLKWSPHIINIVARSNRMLGFKYSVIVSTSLTYMLVLWSALICRSVVKSALYKVRRLLICFFSKEFNVVQPNSFCRTMNHRMLKKLDLILITYWHEIKVIVSLYKCKSDIYELDINQFIPSTRSTSGDLRPNLCKTSLFRNSYFNRIVFLWNSLPSHIKSSSSVSILKSKLYLFYKNNRNSSFEIDRPRTWKTMCSKCRSLQISCCS